jgi:hypothetical protein
MRKRTRLATTAGVTVLGFTAVSGMTGLSATAHADTVGLGLPVDLTGPLAKTGPVGKTVDTVVKQTTSGSHGSGGSGLRVNLPVNLRLGGSRSSGRSAPVVKTGVKTSVKASTNPLAVRARVNVHLCAHPPQECGPIPSPPSPVPPTPPIPIPPGPPTPPPAPPVGNPSTPLPPGAAEPAASSLTVIGDSLPFTGGPIGALTLLGATAVLTGAAGVAGSRRKAGRDA